MLKRVLVLALVAGVAVFAGCGEKGGQGGKGGAASGRVAVVNLNKILEDSGHASDLTKTREILAENLNRSVQVVQSQLQNQLVTMAKDIGPRPKPAGATPTDKETEAIKEWTVKARKLEQGRLNVVNQIRQKYAQQRQANQATINAKLAEIGKRIQPLAKQIAKNKGLDIVVRAASVVAYDDAVDITAEVFEEVTALQKEGNFPTVKIPELLQIRRTTTTQPAEDTTTTPKTGAPKAP
ncbi:MAG: OmpH family outer membrane protein [Phycisphaerales bacterium]|jgi:Skp family chaperone for outer membrane proteins|nr:OmpH family outer membrane protein [Phycisphaerales bacterium]